VELTVYKYMFAALRDIIPVFQKVVHDDPKIFIGVYMKEIYDRLKTVSILYKITIYSW
jgi:hypothetical protein